MAGPSGDIGSYGRRSAASIPNQVATSGTRANGGAGRGRRGVIRSKYIAYILQFHIYEPIKE